MGFRIAHIHEYTKFVALDLGSYRVRATLYAFHEGHLTIEGHASVRQSRKNFAHGAIADMQGVAIALEKAIHEACKKSSEIPEDIILGFSPALAIHDTISSQYIRNDPDEPLSMEEIDKMIEKIEQISLSQAKQKAHTQHGIIHDDIRLISSTLTDIHIDGKRITNPLGFTGSQVRISVLNVFCLSSEFNIIRSIVSSLKKRTISVVPMPLIFPKIAEKHTHSYDDTVYIDIGYMHTTFVFEKGGSISFFESFPFGADMLLDMLISAFPGLSRIEVENILAHPKTDEHRSGLVAPLEEYLAYIIDILCSLLEKNQTSPHKKNIFVSGGMLSAPWIRDMFFDRLRLHHDYEFHGNHLIETVPDFPFSPEYLVTAGLSSIAEELLFRKKDPLIRILRYALYHYE